MARVMSELSEEEQNRLVAEHQQLPHGDRGKWIDAQDVTRPSFYGRRRTQAMGLKGSKRGRPPGSKNEPVTDLFRDADETTRRRMLAEYERLPHSEKAAWRESQQITLAMTAYYRNKFAKTPPRKTSTALARHHETAIKEIPVAQARPLPQPLNGSPTDHTIHSLTFDDAVSVIKVRRDMYNQIYSDIINDLQRMKQ